MPVLELANPRPLYQVLLGPTCKAPPERAGEERCDQWNLISARFVAADLFRGPHAARPPFPHCFCRAIPHMFRNGHPDPHESCRA